MCAPPRLLRLLAHDARNLTFVRHERVDTLGESAPMEFVSLHQLLGNITSTVSRRQKWGRSLIFLVSAAEHVPHGTVQLNRQFVGGCSHGVIGVGGIPLGRHLGGSFVDTGKIIGVCCDTFCEEGWFGAGEEEVICNFMPWCFDNYYEKVLLNIGEGIR